jgi:hypothetical protein
LIGGVREISERKSGGIDREFCGKLGEGIHSEYDVGSDIDLGV